MLDEFLSEMPAVPILARFAIAMVAILLVPPQCQRIKLPAVVGLVAVGVLIGPHGLQIGPKQHEVAEFFADVGKLLLMFFAGLEIDLQQFLRTRNRSIKFGVLTFSLPLAAGAGAGLAFGYTWLSAMLIGSLLASHTLLGFQIAKRLGIVRNEAVTVTIGATVFTDIASLLVLAICLPIHLSGFSTRAFVIQVVQLAVYIPLVLFGLSSLVGYLLRRFHDSKDRQFLIIMVSLVVTAMGAELINLEGIIGAFLTGLALNRAVRHSPAKEDLEFLGNTLFIPVFFIMVGFLIDLRVFAETIVSRPAMVAAIVGGLIVAKLLAAAAASKAFGYSRNECFTMWSLSLPQVAATLASALVAYQAKNAEGVRLIDEPILNSVIVMMVVTSLLGPIMTEVFGKRLPEAHEPHESTHSDNSSTTRESSAELLKGLNPSTLNKDSDRGADGY
jgi:Kef-type K+ transport system membrane component KefB